MRRNRQKEKTPDASVHISPSIPGMAAVILPIVLRRSALWYIQIKFSSSTVKCIIPHTSNSFFLVLAAAFFGLVACLLSASCLRIDGRGLRILTSRRSSLLIMAYTRSGHMKTMLNRMFSKFQTCRNRIWRRCRCCWRNTGQSGIKRGLWDGKKV